MILQQTPAGFQTSLALPVFTPNWNTKGIWKRNDHMYIKYYFILVSVGFIYSLCM